MSVGNHEVWGDPKIEGTLAAVPYLKNFGVTPERLIYKFDFRDIRFIFLWSGKYDYRSPSLWDADRPKYAEQMVQLQQWLDDAKAKGIKKTFISFHYPVFCRAGLGPIPEPDNPHKTIAAYAKDMAALNRVTTMSGTKRRERCCYFVNIGLVGAGGAAAAGERLKVSQRFQPAGRFSFANSP